MVKITINRVSVTVASSSIGYEQVRDLAGLTGYPSCTWRDSDGRGGVFSPGTALTVRDGMVFNIIHTGNA